MSLPWFESIVNARRSASARAPQGYAFFPYSMRAKSVVVINRLIEVQERHEAQNNCWDELTWVVCLSGTLWQRDVFGHCQPFIDVWTCQVRLGVRQP
jgi:hypothetical protein